jgi:hypothetical protein
MPRCWLLLVVGSAAFAACSENEQAEDCGGPGVYQRGKEGGVSCCARLTEYHRQVVNRAPPEPSCQEPVGFAAFGCVQGSCGDGVCETGEDGACGCTLDCGASTAPR